MKKRQRIISQNVKSNNNILFHQKIAEKYDLAETYLFGSNLLIFLENKLAFRDVGITQVDITLFLQTQLFVLSESPLQIPVRYEHSIIWKKSKKSKSQKIDIFSQQIYQKADFVTRIQKKKPYYMNQMKTRSDYLAITAKSEKMQFTQQNIKTPGIHYGVVEIELGIISGNGKRWELNRKDSLNSTKFLKRKGKLAVFPNQKRLGYVNGFVHQQTDRMRQWVVTRKSSLNHVEFLERERVVFQGQKRLLKYMNSVVHQQIGRMRQWQLHRNAEVNLWQPDVINDNGKWWEFTKKSSLNHVEFLERERVVFQGQKRLLKYMNSVVHQQIGRMRQWQLHRNAEVDLWKSDAIKDDGKQLETTRKGSLNHMGLLEREEVVFQGQKLLLKYMNPVVHQQIGRMSQWQLHRNAEVNLWQPDVINDNGKWWVVTRKSSLNHVEFLERERVVFQGQKRLRKYMNSVVHQQIGRMSQWQLHRNAEVNLWQPDVINDNGKWWEFTRKSSLNHVEFLERERVVFQGQKRLLKYMNSVVHQQIGRMSQWQLHRNAEVNLWKSDVINDNGKWWEFTRKNSLNHMEFLEKEEVVFQGQKLLLRYKNPVVHQQIGRMRQWRLHRNAEVDLWKLDAIKDDGKQLGTTKKSSLNHVALLEREEVVFQGQKLLLRYKNPVVHQQIGRMRQWRLHRNAEVNLWQPDVINDNGKWWEFTRKNSLNHMEFLEKEEVVFQGQKRPLRYKNPVVHQQIGRMRQWQLHRNAEVNLWKLDAIKDDGKQLGTTKKNSLNHMGLLEREEVVFLGQKLLLRYMNPVVHQQIGRMRQWQLHRNAEVNLWQPDAIKDDGKQLGTTRKNSLNHVEFLERERVVFQGQKRLLKYMNSVVHQQIGRMRQWHLHRNAEVNLWQPDAIKDDGKQLGTTRKSSLNHVEFLERERVVFQGQKRLLKYMNPVVHQQIGRMRQWQLHRNAVVVLKDLDEASIWKRPTATGFENEELVQQKLIPQEPVYKKMAAGATIVPMVNQLKEEHTVVKSDNLLSRKLLEEQSVRISKLEDHIRLQKNFSTNQKVSQGAVINIRKVTSEVVREMEKQLILEKIRRGLN